MKKIGIVCASDTELAPFLHRLENTKITDKAMLKFHEGTLGGADVIALYSGVCKVNAAITTQILIDTFHVNAVISAGTAGGMDESIRIFDTVVAEQTAYYDVAGNILTEFHPWLETVYFPSNEKLLDLARQYSHDSKHPIFFGKTVTGEQFVEDKKREKINRKFSPLCADMETASIAHVCYVNQVPFISIRTITDTASHEGIANFEKNCKRASEISAEIVAGVINKLKS